MHKRALNIVQPTYTTQHAANQVQQKAMTRKAQHRMCIIHQAARVMLQHGTACRHTLQYATRSNTRQAMQRGNVGAEDSKVPAWRSIAYTAE